MYDDGNQKYNTHDIAWKNSDVGVTAKLCMVLKKRPGVIKLVLVIIDPGGHVKVGAKGPSKKTASKSSLFACLFTSIRF